MMIYHDSQTNEIRSSHEPGAEGFGGRTTVHMHRSLDAANRCARKLARLQDDEELHREARADYDVI